MKYLLLFTTLIFAAEMEVDGNLKVTGTVDASGNPITNVGTPLSMSDAINGNVLLDALRDDTTYEYKIYAIQTHMEVHNWNIDYQECITGQDIQFPNWTGQFHDELISLLSGGWKIDQTIDLSPSGGYNTPSNNSSKKLLIFKRKVLDD